MTSYKYSFPLSDETLGSIRSLDEEGWHRLFIGILKNRPVPYNIDFSEFQPATRLCELYDIVMTYHLDAGPYQIALTRLLSEYYGNEREVNITFSLISAVDYVKPSLHYNRLQQLATKPEYAPMIDAEGPDGYSIHFHLVNTLMTFDTDRKLLDFLFSLRHKEQRPEYYQVTIRYLYSYCGQPPFDLFMNAIILRLEDSRLREFVVRSFQEVVFYQQDFRLLYCWLFKEKERLSGKEQQPAFLLLSEDIMNWLHTSNEFLRDTKGYDELWAFLSTYFKGQFVFTPAMLEKLIRTDETEMYNKQELLPFLGHNYWDMRVVWNGETSGIQSEGPVENAIPEEFGTVVQLYEDSTRSGVQSHYKQTDRRSWAIPDDLVEKSIKIK